MPAFNDLTKYFITALIRRVSTTTRMPGSGQIKSPRSWQSAAEAEYEEAYRLEAVIKPLVDNGPVSNARVYPKWIA